MTLCNVVELNNSNIVEMFDDVRKQFFAMPDHGDIKYGVQGGEFWKVDPELYMSRSLLMHQLNKGNKHTGFPEQHYAHPLQTYFEKGGEQWEDLFVHVRQKIPQMLGAHTAALSNYYPPGGFVGWHTNWNAAAYQILFTWSLTGDGYFLYYDKSVDQIIKVPDNKGWQCRWMYFGARHEPQHHLWHAAYTKCNRLTFAFKFMNEGKDSPHDKVARQLLDQLVDDIQLNT